MTRKTALLAVRSSLQGSGNALQSLEWEDEKFFKTFRESGIPMSLDAIKTVFKQIERHFKR